ncbi:hypothetical protein [Atopococcus tabaci]|uniref:hypothetical protein n=1 Tax=Atopococcus tabaci TaxID=269774 RepID=UPI0004806222|nr:hypothetical protein [Atopococcus tabaci]
MKKALGRVMNKLNLKYTFCFSLLVFLIGVVLTLNLVPVSGVNEMSEEEIAELLSIGAINYPLGRWLMFCSLFMMVLVVVIYAFKKIKR